MLVYFSNLIVQLINQWIESPIDLDLGLEVEAATGEINPDRINSAGDFVNHFISDELPQSAIENTEGPGVLILFRLFSSVGHPKSKLSSVDL